MENNDNNNVDNKNNEQLETIGKIVSFCIPLVGIVLWLVHKNSAPQKSKDACNAALWGIGLGILLNIIVAVVGGSMLSY